MSAAIPDDLDCIEVVELVTDYLEDKLALDERTRFEQHLLWCAPCAVYLRQIRSAARLSRDLKAPVAPAARDQLAELFRSFHKSRV
jgi:anti-sigma factor RsiW